eukprot:2500259-Pleurochrysis_carterae.AAC.1
MRPKAGLKLRKLRKLQHTHGLFMYPSMYDGVQMFKELRDELANLHDAYDSDEHERQIETCVTSCCLTIARGRTSQTR